MKKAFVLFLTSFIAIVFCFYPVLDGVFDSLKGRGSAIHCIKKNWNTWFSVLDTFV